MQHTTEKPSKLKSGIASLEDAIIVISGPCLAVSGIVAGVDLVTGGNLLKSMGWLTLAWAITLLLTLDFQVLTLGVRAHRVYSSSKSMKRKVIEVAIAVLIAAAISFVSIQMQSIIARVNAESISLDLAAAQLGINMIWLIWERSTLVLVLIFISGWLREHDSTPVPSISAEHMAVILAKLEKLDALEQHITGQMQAIVIEPVENAEHMPMLKSGLNAFQDVQVDNGVSTVDSGMDNEQKIRALLASDSTLSARAIAKRIGCSPTIASKWKTRIQSQS